MLSRQEDSRRRSFKFLLLFLALIDSPLHAGWVAIDQRYQSPGLQTVYVDPDSIRREGHLVTLSALIDWTWMQGNRSPTRFYSTTFTKQFDCAKQLVRTLVATDFYGHMGTGDVIGGSAYANERHWRNMEPHALDQGLWDAACGER